MILRINNMEDISIFNVDAITTKSISDDELKMNLESSLKSILRKEFPGNPQKQYVKVKRTEFNFACPFCGDSATDAHKKRAHILLDGKFKGLFKCFNCGKSMEIGKFFKAFGTDFDLSTNDKLIEMGNEIGHRRDEMIENGLDLIIDIDAVKEYSINIEDLKHRTGFQEISTANKNEAFFYLIGRNQFLFSNYLYDPGKRNLVVLNKLDNDHIVGYQLRDLTGNRQAKYLSYTLDRIHKEIMNDNVEVPENLNALSLMFNIFNVNVRKPIIITEGPMDSFLVNNAIASAGANKDVPLKFQFYYLYDDDETGRKHAIEKISEGKHVFLWNKLKAAYNLPQKKKWDVNDVINYLAERGIKTRINWYEYFSNDMFDIIDI